MAPERVERGRALLERLRDGLGRVILGQPELIDLTVIALAARGHVLLEGLPGLGKTQLVRSLADLLGLAFRRVQFTPDLLPSDITGGPILEERDGRRQFVFHPGPLFANVVLADEINRASPKTQSALLEAMQERRVTALGESHALPDPFFVLATQNPIELEGTYPLPEAQLDRFLFKVEVGRVAPEVLETIIRERRRGTPPPVERALDGEELAELFATVDAVYLPAAVARYVARLVEASHPASPSCPAPVRGWVRYGASPRAAIAIAEAARAAALLAGRPNVDFDDVARVAPSALAHRLVLQHAARLEDVSAREVVRTLLDAVPVVPDALPEVVA
ncbi:MAG: AAA family ATPase [Planctomycetota bacterium]|nr:MAG: AAA family ATPase [Planctomycetota bacterium]